MKISLNWISQYTELKLPTDELLSKIGAQLGAIEEIEEWSPRFDGIVVAKVVSCKKHPNADKLHVCLIDDNKATKGVKRDKNGYIEVVCGAPNVKTGLLVAWLPPGTTVPSTPSKDPLVLEAREIRGIVSNGMLASAHELGISDDHSGILEIDIAEVGAQLAKPGAPFKNLYGLNDTVIDIENKMFTHRPDCFGILGVARELAGIQGLAFKSPDWYLKSRNNKSSSTKLNLKVTNPVPSLVPRFMTQIVEDIEVGPSPIWLAAQLTRVGIRPINNIVDWSNYYMHLTGQPTHAFDYDKIKNLSTSTPTLMPRLAKKGEKLTLLGGKTINLEAEDIIIATDKQVVGLAGVMGGADSEVDDTTKNIIIECATFDMYTIRRTSMHHGLFTDAVTRFNKGQSPFQNDRVLADITNAMTKVGGRPTKLTDLKGQIKTPTMVRVSADFISQRLGLELSPDDIQKILENVEFKVERTDNRQELKVSAPFWRTDIAIAEDVVEEVGRLYGYDQLPLVLPKRDLSPVSKNQLLVLKSSIREILSRAGANEVLTYSFVHGNLLDRVGQDKTKAFKLSNASSPDLQYYRLSLTPSLLDKVHLNVKAGYDQFALFELGKTHMKGEFDKHEPAIPREQNAVGFVFVAGDKAAQNLQGAAYYQAKIYLDHLLKHFKVQTLVALVPFDTGALSKNSWIKQLTMPYEPGRSALMRDHKGTVWGVIGELKASVRHNLKLPAYTSAFEVGPLLLGQGASESAYLELPRFPKVEQDLSLKVSNRLTYAEVYKFVLENLNKLKPESTQMTLTPLDIYQKNASAKNITLRLHIASFETTLTDEGVNNLLDKVAKLAKQALGAERL